MVYYDYTVRMAGELHPFQSYKEEAIWRAVPQPAVWASPENVVERQFLGHPPDLTQELCGWSPASGVLRSPLGDSSVP